MSEEKADYQRGYKAGRKRLDRELLQEAQRKIDQDYFRALMLAALPVAMEIEGWQLGGKPIASMTERADLAIMFAKDAFSKSKDLP